MGLKKKSWGLIISNIILTLGLIYTIYNNYEQGERIKKSEYLLSSLEHRPRFEVLNKPWISNPVVIVAQDDILPVATRDSRGDILVRDTSLFHINPKNRVVQADTNIFSLNDIKNFIFGHVPYLIKKGGEGRLSVTLNISFINNSTNSIGEVVATAYSDSLTDDILLKDILKNKSRKVKVKEVEKYSKTFVPCLDSITFNVPFDMSIGFSDSACVHFWIIYRNELNQYFDTYCWIIFKNIPDYISTDYDIKSHTFLMKYAQEDIIEYDKHISNYHIYSEDEKKELEDALNRIKH